jgi:hypothetical protein
VSPRHAAGVGFAVGFAAAWFVAAVVQIPLLWYLPLERRFVFETTVTSLGIDYYGRLVFCTLAGGLCALVGRVIGRRGAPIWWVYGAVWVSSLVALTFALEVALLWRRVPVPLISP